MANETSRLQRLRAEARALLDERTLSQGPRPKLQRLIHFWVMVVRSFNSNRCPARASALAYATLLALIPMLAVVMSVSSSFLKQEGEARIDQLIEKFVASVTPPDMLSTNIVSSATNTLVTVTNVSVAKEGAGAVPPQATPSEENPAAAEVAKPPSQTNVTEISRVAWSSNQTVMPSFLKQDEAVQARKRVAKHINEYIQNARSGALGVTGSVLLIFAAISMLQRIEATFNDIWGVPRARSWWMQVVLYWSVTTFAPLLLIVALGLATGPHLEGTRKLLTHYPFLASMLFRVLPVVVLCVTFSTFYMLMPNTRVSWRAAVVGGCTAALLFHLNNLFSVLYVSRVVSNSRIYGSLGLVPVLMIGLYLSWLIVLFGAQVAYGWQNRASYLEEKQIENINQRGREFVALRLMTCIGQSFHNGQAPLTVSEMAKELALPARLARQVLQTLAAAQLVVETAGSEAAFLPARPLETITCHDILMAMRAAQGQELATREGPAREEVYGEFARIEEAERRVASGVSMLTLVNRAEAAKPLPPATVPA